MQINVKKLYDYIDGLLSYIRISLFIVFFSYTGLCVADSSLAISVDADEGKIKLGFMGKNQTFPEIYACLKKISSIDTNLTVSFKVQQEVITINQIIDMTFEIQKLGFSTVFLETCVFNKIEDKMEIRKIKLIAITRDLTTKPVISD